MIPKYQIIFNQLLEKIQCNMLKPGDLLPSEFTLMAQYQASRDTIRKTLNLLQAQGYIQKIMGKGSIVLDKGPITLSFSGIRSFQEVANALPDTKITTELIQFKSNYIPTENEDAFEFHQKLMLNHNACPSSLLYVERIRKINGESIILDEDYLCETTITDLTPDIASISLYAYIEKTLKLVIGYAKREITVIQATDKDKLLLDMQHFEFLICVTSYTYLEDTRLFQFTRSKHRPDKFKFVEFARR